LLAAMQMPPRDLLREKGTPYAELGLDNPDLTDGQLLDAMLAHPILINRPIVETPKACVSAARPKLSLICSTSPVARFVKEDGEVVTFPAGA
jgi:arsenate reductase